MTGRPPMHVLTRASEHGISTHSPTDTVMFGDVVIDREGRERIFAGCAADGRPYLVSMSVDDDQLDYILRRLTRSRRHHETPERTTDV